MEIPIPGWLARRLFRKTYDELDKLANVTGKASRSKMLYHVKFLWWEWGCEATFTSEVIGESDAKD